MPIKAGKLNPFGIVQACATIWLAGVAATALVLEGTGAT